MASADHVSRETGGSSEEKNLGVGEALDVKVKVEDTNATNHAEIAESSRVVNTDATTTTTASAAIKIEPNNTSQVEVDAGSASQVEIPSAAVKAANMSSSDDSSSMPPPPAVVRAAPPSTTVSLNASSTATAQSNSAKIPPAVGTTSTVTPTTSATSSPVKQEIKPVPPPTRPVGGPSNPIVRTGLVPGRPAVQSSTPAAVAKLQGHTNPAISSPAIPKSSPPPAPAAAAIPDVTQSATPRYQSISTASSDISSHGGNASGGSSNSGSKKKTPHPLRRGKWTTEEEAYANRLINEFKSGLLPLTDGTTLRNFLSKLLNCDPMRISKKFVGNNCIGKQVFRRRVAEINRITPDQMQQTKMDLSELERRFLDRVAQTNRVKAPGVSAAIGPNGVLGPLPPNLMKIGGVKGGDDLEMDAPPTPPWLRPPAKYKPTGKFAERLEAKAKAAAERKAKLAAAAAAAAATAAQASASSAAGESKRTQPLKADSSLEQLTRTASNEGVPRTESALEQLARTASAAKFVEDIVNGDGSDEAKVGGKKLSQSALQGSFDALMSMDLQSVENLVELASSSNLASLLTESKSSAQMETFIQNLSSGNLLKSGNESHVALGGLLQSLSKGNLLKVGEDSHVALGNLLQSIQTDLHDENSSSNNLFDPEKFINRAESVTGFSKLRTKDGLAKGGSVEDFLSLMASGDIPHQDPSLLNVPLQKVMQQYGVGAANSLKRKLSQQQLSALASRISRSRLAGSASNINEKGSVKKQRIV
ncbi:hypothetical protein ACHAWC_009701 [Mediolabrus comicus]